jgi:hypothetical protein
VNVISYNQAAIKAGVSRQRITKLKRDHKEKKKIQSYFVFDPDNGKEGINIDDPSWKSYENKNNKKRVNKNVSTKETESKPSDNENENYVNKNAFAKAVIDAAREQLGLSNKDLKKFMGLIQVKYEGER